MNKLRKNSKKGFTLVEIIVVLVIIAILLAALAPVMIGWINDARDRAAMAEGRTVLVAAQSVLTEAVSMNHLTAGTNAKISSAGTNNLPTAPVNYQTKFTSLVSGVTATYEVDFTITGGDPIINFITINSSGRDVWYQGGAARVWHTGIRP
jgi:type IV pilus assembly protein PilA